MFAESGFTRGLRDDKHGFYLSFQIREFNDLNRYVSEFEKERPGLRVTKVLPGRLTNEEARVTEPLSLLETDFIVNIDYDGNHLFLFTAVMEYR